VRVQEVLREAGLEDAEDAIAMAIADGVAAMTMVLDHAPAWSADEEKLLTSGGFDPTPARPGEREVWLTQLAANYARLVATSLSVPDAARILSVDVSRVRQRLSDHTLYGFKVRRQWRIPSWQFVNDREVPGLADVLPSLVVGDPTSVSEFFLTPNIDLVADGEPLAAIQWLLAGRPPARVRDLIEALTST
jgi:hypothetical protein